MIQITAHIETISTGVERAHSTESERVEAIQEALRSGATMPLPLVIEDGGNGAMVLDGHHRIQALRDEGADKCEAWVVSLDDYNRLIEEEFAGDSPSRLSDLDDYIIVDGTSYERPE